MPDNFQKWIPPEFSNDDHRCDTAVYLGIKQKPGAVNFCKNYMPEAAMKNGSSIKFVRSFDLPEKILGLAESNGKIIVATSEGAYEYNPDSETFDQIPFRKELPPPITVPDKESFLKACEKYKQSGNHPCAGTANDYEEGV